MHDRLELAIQTNGCLPRCIHSSFINGEYNGLFSLVEQIDEQFTDFIFQMEQEIYTKKFGLKSDNSIQSDKNFIKALLLIILKGLILLSLKVC